MQTVLLIEDSKLQRMTSEHLFKKAGYRVLIAVDGEEGLRIARETRPDLILLDMMLPKLGGQELLHSLKSDPTTSRIPAVVLTGLSQKNEERLLAEGAAAFIEKSYALDNPQLFLQRIKRILDGSPVETRVPHA